MTTRKHLYTLPGDVTFPSVVGLPENYPFVKDGELYLLQGGSWVLAGGGGGVAFTDTGVWTPGRTYEPGELMQYGGRSFLAPVTVDPAMDTTTISDDFNRPNNLLTGSTTSVGGKVWVDVAGPQAYVSGNALDISNSGDSTAATAIDSGMTTDCVVQATFKSGAMMGFVVRGIDSTHYYNVKIGTSAGYLTIWSKNGVGGFTNLFSSFPTTFNSVSGDVWTVELAGSQISVKQNGVAAGSISDSTHNGSLQGIFNGGSNHLIIDDFSVVGQAASDTPDLSKFIGATLDVGVGATGARPDAAKIGAGAQFFDSTLGKPIWSTGSVWVDATGATV